jgi:DNA alkylation repair enzyme
MTIRGRGVATAAGRAGGGATRDGQANNVGRLVEQIDMALCTQGTPERAEYEMAYLNSELEHYGTSVPAIRSVAKEVASQHPGLSHDDLVALVAALWAAPVHERRMICRTARYLSRPPGRGGRSTPHAVMHPRKTAVSAVGTTR